MALFLVKGWGGGGGGGGGGVEMVLVFSYAECNFFHISCFLLSSYFGVSVIRNSSLVINRVVGGVNC